MNKQYKQQLESNIKKYAWYKIFTKRVYLPLIAIQLVNIGHVTVAQLAIIAMVVSVVQLVLQIPGGYFADKWGNRPAILIGSAIAAVSPLVYIIRPDFYGGLVADLLFFGGYCLISGAIEAFMHDTLTALKREKDYARVMGRAQSYGLIGNTVLLVAIPATYALHHSLPFILGFISLSVNFLLAASFTYPRLVHKTKVKIKKPFTALRSIVTVANLSLFLFAGLLFGVTHRGGNYRELVYQDVGIPIEYFGILVAVGSLVGVLFGFCLGLVDKLKARTFYLLDLTIIAACMIAVGAGENPIVVVSAFVIFAAYDRVRLILIQSRLLQEVEHAYKATLLSALSLFSVMGEIVMIALLAYFIELGGYQEGYLWFGGVVLCAGLLLYIAVLASLKTASNKLKKN